MLWKKEDADVILLASTEQEIHATIKVRSSSFSWLISTIYANPRLAKRYMLLLTYASQAFLAYTRKPVYQDNHITIIMHTIKHESAPTTVALSAYPHYKVKSSHD